MRRALIRTLDALIWIAILAMTVGGAFAGGKLYLLLQMQPIDPTQPLPAFNWTTALMGGIAGFLASVATFGIMAVLIQIEENTRATRAVFEALIKRAETRLAAGDNP